MPAVDRATKVAFQRDLNTLGAEIEISQNKINEMNNKVKYIKEAIKLAEQPIEKLSGALLNIETKLKGINTLLHGDSVKRRLDIGQKRNPANRIESILHEQKYSTAAPTTIHLDSYKTAKGEFSVIKQKVKVFYEVDFKALEQQLKDAGAPYTPGRLLNSHKN